MSDRKRGKRFIFSGEGCRRMGVVCKRFKVCGSCESRDKPRGLGQRPEQFVRGSEQVGGPQDEVPDGEKHIVGSIFRGHLSCWGCGMGVVSSGGGAAGAGVSLNSRFYVESAARFRKLGAGAGPGEQRSAGRGS